MTKKIRPKKQSSNIRKIDSFEFFFIGSVAVVADLLDGVGIDFIFFHIVDFAVLGILVMWCLLRMKKFPSARLGVTTFVEFIPFLGDISPTWTVFIISLYLQQRKEILLSKKKL